MACYHGVLSDGVVALLQVLQLQLCDVVLRHLGALHADGVQQGIVAEDLLVQQLRGNDHGKHCAVNDYLLSGNVREMSGNGDSSPLREYQYQ